MPSRQRQQDETARSSSTNRASHVNYIWPSREAVTYPCFPPGEDIPVFRLDSGDAQIDLLDPRTLLITRVLERPRRVYSHCHHYARHSACDLGPLCGFVHAVTIDPSVGRRRRLRHRTASRSSNQAISSSSGSLGANTTSASTLDSAWESQGSSAHITPRVRRPSASACPLGSDASLQASLQCVDTDRAVTVPSVATRSAHNPLCDEEEHHNPPEGAPSSTKTNTSRTSSSSSARIGWYHNPYAAAQVFVAMDGPGTSNSSLPLHQEGN